VPRGNGGELAPHIHADPANSAVHRLHAARVVQPDDRELLDQHTLCRNGIGGNGDPRERAECLKETELGISAIP